MAEVAQVYGIPDYLLTFTNSCFRLWSFVRAHQVSQNVYKCRVTMITKDAQRSQKKKKKIRRDLLVVRGGHCDLH